MLSLKAIFHCSRFDRAGGATNFNHVKNQSPGHAKKVECSSTLMACPRAFRRTKNAQVRQLQRKLSNVRSARAGKATAMENCLKAPHRRAILTRKTCWPYTRERKLVKINVPICTRLTTFRQNLRVFILTPLQIEQRNVNEKHSNLLFWDPRCLVCKRYKKVTAFVFTWSRQALRFHLAPFRNRAQIVSAKEAFSNNFVLV
jgi:hypothetical protein